MDQLKAFTVTMTKPNTKTLVTTFLVLLVVMLEAPRAWGAGYQLRYQGAETMGTAFASQGTYGDSLSSVYFNPALFLLQNKKQAVALEAMVIHPMNPKFTSVKNVKYEDFVGSSLSGALFYGYKFNDTMSLTLALTTPWGTETSYPNDWVGQYAGIENKLTTLNLQAVLSKRLNKKWLVSLGPQVQSLKASFSRRISPATSVLGNQVLEFSGDDMGFGAVLALTYEHNDKLRANLTYHSQIKHNLEGDLSVNPLGDNGASLELSTPDTLNLGLSYQYREKWISHFSLSYTNWSLLKTLDVENASDSNFPSDLPGVKQNWSDTYLIALGATHFYNEKWTLRGGFSYETGAVKNRYRGPSSRDANRVGIGLGGSYQIKQALNLDFALNHINYISEAKITNSQVGGSEALGEFSGTAAVLRVGLEYSF